MRPFTLSAVLFLGACSLVPAPKPARYRTLVLDVAPGPPVARAAAAGVGRAAPSVALREVELPAYLESDLLVTRVGDHEIRYAKDERWGEPLAAAVPRILAAQLARQGLEVRAAGSAADAWVEVTVERFETDARGRGELRGRWTIHRRGAPTRSHEVRLVADERGAAPANLSALLERLAEAIAADVREDGETPVSRS